MKIYRIAESEKSEKSVEVRIKPTVKVKDKKDDPEDREEKEADACPTVSPSSIYSRYDVIQEREDLAPSMLRKRKKQKEQGDV